MKTFLALFFLSILTVNANTVDSIYNTDSELHSELKSEIAEALASKYSCINAYGLKEIDTTFETEEVDQGIVDYYYTTTFSVSYTYDFHPNNTKLVVKSVKYAGSNPTIKWTHIESVEGQILCD